MLSALFTHYQQTVQMMIDSSKVLSRQLPSWHPHADTPKSLNLDMWLEVCSNSQGVVIAYQQAVWLFHTEVVKISKINTPLLSRIPIALVPSNSTPITAERPTDKNAQRVIENKTNTKGEPSTINPQYSLL